MLMLLCFLANRLKNYTELLQESREQAYERMLEQAKTIGAKVMLNVRFSTSSRAAYQLLQNRFWLRY